MESIESAVRRRISELAHRPGNAPWGPVPYDPKYLELVPDEVRRRDHGCGDPTPFLKAGDAVLDLGSGSGKGAYVMAQAVGADGLVIGVDIHRDMLALSRKFLGPFADRVGYSNVDFRCGRIQDLRLDLDELGALMAACPIRDQWGYLELRDLEDRLRREDPLVADASFDAAVANGVLGLIRPEDRPRVFAEVRRALRPGGRFVVCDLVADRDPPAGFHADPECWSLGLGGVATEEALLRGLDAAGFRDVRAASRRDDPACTAREVAFHLVTVAAAGPVAAPTA